MESGPYFKAIKKNALIFYKNVSKNPSDFVIHLYSEDVITSKEKKDFMEKLAEGKSSEWICGELLDYLEVRNDTHSEKVIEAMRKTDNHDVANAILKTYNELTGKNKAQNADNQETGDSVNEEEKYEKLKNHPNANILVETRHFETATILSKNSGFVRKWVAVYQSLMGNNSELVSLQRQYKNDCMTPYEIADAVLSKWESGVNARISTLYKTLIDVDLPNLANTLLDGL